MLKFKGSFMVFINTSLLLFTLTMVFSRVVINHESIYLYLNLGNWGLIDFKFLLLIDQISLLFMSTVGLITFSVFMFSYDYMKSEKFYVGFHMLILAFVISMLILILSPNLLSAMLGWDGLGLSSYLLVIFYSNGKAYYSGMITALTNRLGDIFILLAIGMSVIMGSWTIKYYNEMLNSSFYWTLALILVASCTKSAQLPFCAWLPAAMAAPTPVSSLVHSSTLVTAGVYLMIRHEHILANLNLGGLLLYMGMGTMVMSSMSAAFESDMKKMVALSTLSQLGVMMVSIGLGAYFISFLHLLAHAFFKALLFIATGLMIHSSMSYQDIRVMGGMASLKPEVMSVVSVASVSLMGLPFASGFFSKEMILENILMNNNNVTCYLMFFAGALMTSFYSARFITEVYIAFPKKESMSLAPYSSFSDMASMSLLLFPGLLGGWFLSKLMFFSTMLFTSNFFMKLILVVLIFFSLALSKYWNLSSKITSYGTILSILNLMWMMPNFTSSIPSGFLWKKSLYVKKLTEQGGFLVFTSMFPLFVHSYLYNKSFPLKSQNMILISIMMWLVLLNLYYY